MFNYSTASKERSNLTPIILAGGKGTRLKAVINDRPKVLAPIAGRPFITYLLDFLDSNNFKQVIIAIGYMADLIIETLGYRYKNINIVYTREEMPLGTGGGLRLACGEVRTDDCLVLNGDSFAVCNLEEYYNWFLSNNITAALYLTFLEDISRYGSVDFDQNYNILQFSEKNQTGSGYINAGMYLFKKDLLLTMRENEQLSLENDFLPGLINKNFKAFYNEAKGLNKFIDIGIPEAYNIAEDFFADITV